MSVTSNDVGGGAEDELIDQNAQSVERKRKRDEMSTDEGKEVIDGLPQATGKLLRSRTLLLRNGGNQVTEASSQGEAEVPVLGKRQKMVGRRGRPSKKEGECRVSSSTFEKIIDDAPTERENQTIKSMEDDENEFPAAQEKQKMKGRRGRPPKIQGKCEVSSSNFEKGADGAPIEGLEQVIMSQDADVDEIPVSQKRQKVKGRRGRPPKIHGNGVVSSSAFEYKADEAAAEGQVIKSEVDKINDPDEFQESQEKKKMERRRGRPPKIQGKCEAAIEAEKQVVEKEIIKLQNESELPVSQKRKTMKARRGRPPKEGKCTVPSLTVKKKGEPTPRGERLGFKREVKKMEDGSVPGLQRGRKAKGEPGSPPKMGRCRVPSLSLRKKDGKALQRLNEHGTGQAVKQVKPRRGRPPKESIMMLDGDSVKLGNGTVKLKEGTAVSAEGKDTRPKEQKQSLREQILAMLLKAGWKVEYRQRQSKDYQDAVYVDREGKTHWSITLAYKKLKMRIDEGTADHMDTSAFTPIPEETLALLYRITQKGKKAGKTNKASGKAKRISGKKYSKGTPVDKKVKSRLSRGRKRTLLARRPRDGPDTEGYELYEGKRSLLTWMIDLGIIPDGVKVKFMTGKRRSMLEGKLTRDGIYCDCCNIAHTVLEFGTHVKSEVGNPYQNIYLETGNSLMQCLESSWKKYLETDKIEYALVDVNGDDPNDIHKSIFNLISFQIFFPGTF